MEAGVLKVDASGSVRIDADGLMEKAVEAVFAMQELTPRNPEQFADDLRRVHSALTRMASRFITAAPSAPAAAQPVSSSAAVSASVSPKASASKPSIPVLALVASQGELALGVPPAAKEPTKPAARRASPVLPPEAKPAPRAAKPLTEVFNLVQSVTESPKPKRRRSDAAEEAQRRLPRRLSSKDEAVRMDTIICLEDGKSVQDLGRHLAILGITPEAYREKWSLAADYPMQAPSLIVKRGQEYAFDPTTRRLYKV